MTAGKAATQKVAMGAGAFLAASCGVTEPTKLTPAEIDTIASQISECWDLDESDLNVLRSSIEVRVQLDFQGNVRNVVPASGGIPADPRARAVYESARRALLAPQCNPLKVPANKLQTLMASTFRFNPRGLVR